MPVLAVLCLFQRFFLFFIFLYIYIYICFFLRQLFLSPAPAVLGRRDGSIRALRKRRFRNKTREVAIFQIRVGDGDDGGGGGDGDGRISPEHPSPILHAPRDIISRKGKSLTPICVYVCKRVRRLASLRSE